MIIAFFLRMFIKIFPQESREASRSIMINRVKPPHNYDGRRLN